jgi:hypothetical protein
MKTKILQKTFVAPILVLGGLLLLLGASQSQSQATPDYELSFQLSNGQPLDPTNPVLYVGQELVLHAFVADSSGSPATAGSVSFQVCTHGGRNLSNQDPQPSSACDLYKTASWVTLGGRWKVNGGFCPGEGTGNVCIDYGFVMTPRTIGFRFKYASQGSGIPNGVSEANDVSWIPLP